MGIIKPSGDPDIDGLQGPAESAVDRLAEADAADARHAESLTTPDSDISVSNVDSLLDIVSAPPVFNQSQIIYQLRTQWGGSFEGTTWSWGGAGAINYYIGGTPYASGSFEAFYKTTMTSLQQSRAALAFELWDDLIARSLTQTATAAYGQIQFEYATETDGDGTYAAPSLSYAGTGVYGTTNYNLTRDEIWFNSGWTSHDQDSDMYFGGYGFQTYMHEVGHALGLSHPGSYNANGNPITYIPYAEYAQDNRQYTIMSYFGGYQLGSGWQQDGTFLSRLYSSTPMVDDIAAIQAIYGADMTTRTANTIYGYNCNLAANDPAKAIYDFSLNANPIYSIWDGGGIDTLDCSGYGGPQTINLTPGSYSSVNGMTSNVGIAFNCIIENAKGGSGSDTILGNSADNILDGGGGADSMAGGTGNDTYIVDIASDTITENAGAGADTVQVSFSYTLGNNLENLTLTGSANIDGTGNSADNTIVGNSGNNVLDGGAGADSMAGGAGNDTYIVDNPGDTVTENAGAGTADTVQASASYTLGNNLENLTLTGGANINGTGNSADNTITGNAGNNILDGGLGADAMAGGTGNDTYLVDNAGDAITENAGAGTDTVQISFSYTLNSNLENLTLTGGSNINGTGNSADNTITGNSGNNILDGGLGADAMSGGTGNDTYVVDNVGDSIAESAGAGADMVQASFSYTLSNNLESLTLTGSANINGTGNSGDNSIAGNTGNNILDGGLGADAMAGGTGNDTYVVDNAGDAITESAGAGTDTVQASFSYTLSNNLESLTLIGSGNINGIGNSGDNSIIGNAGNNILDGAAGADSMAGGTGNDTYVIDNAGDTVSENAESGTDMVQASFSYTLSNNLESLTLTGSGNINGNGNGADNTIIGNTGNNALDGGAGADSMAGGAGNDSYVVDNAGDTITENAGAGTDTVQASFTYTLSNNLENLMLTGSANINGTGNSGDNTITGNAGNNVLDGAAGADAMAGGAGNDIYLVDNAGDTTAESAGAGTDTVQASVSFTLGNNLENLTLTGSVDLTGTGNSAGNTITGNAGNNILNGGGGADTMAGGAGNDTYVIDNAGDTATESAGAGTDTVQASISFTLGNNLENLTLAGSGNINGTGNSGDNTITANAGHNILDGGLGVDAMAGGAGNDTYIVDNAGDTATENAGAGTDTVQASISYILGSNLENLTLIGSADLNATGSSVNNTITGNAGNNILDGGLGADAMAGGAGNDTYNVDNAGDTATENTGSGTDTVLTSISFTLGKNFENLTLIGSADLNGTGSSENNTITGNTGNNVLDGGLGVDAMAGGAGNDTYLVNNAGDAITENAAAGTDTVQASISYILGSNLENLILTGRSTLYGTGNGANNTIAGNIGNNVLDGGAGADAMAGGAGKDTYIVDNAGDTVAENADAGTDMVQASVSFTLGNNLENLTLTSSGNINGTGNSGNNTVTGNTGNNVLDGGAGADAMAGGIGNDTYIVDNAGDAVMEVAGAGTDTVQAAISFMLGKTLENLTLTGSADINGTGNSTGNAITGNAGNNVLDGGASADAMAGGAGNDTYVIDNAGDTITEGTGAGADTVQTSISYILGSNLENLALTGSSNVNGTGNSANNSITGNAGNNVLDGGAGADAMAGGLGNDTYLVDNAGDTAAENAGAGADTVQASVSFTLAGNLENLTLTGSTNINGTGNSANNTLTGNAGNNVLEGGLGADTLIGGNGDDTLRIDSSDVGISGGAGFDSAFVQTSTAVTLDMRTTSIEWVEGNAGNDTFDAARQSVGVYIYGLGGADTITGSGLVDFLDGGDGNDTLTGGAGGDSLIAGNGDDSLLIDSFDVSVSGGAGFDSAIVQTRFAVNLNMGATSVERAQGNSGNDVFNAASQTVGVLIYGLGGADTITGSAFADSLDGGDGDDALNGGLGADAMAGGAGNDTYLVDNAGDTATENAGAGTDTVLASVSFTLGGNIENLTLTGSADLKGTGNSANNTITGNAGNNVLDGGAGADTMAGGTGNDTYLVDNVGDAVMEVAGAGTDTAQASIGYTLGSNLENLILTGSADINGTGNSANNTITGNAGNNILDGGAGADAMAGDAGNDTYVVNNAGDTITENAGAGTDTVHASINYILGNNLENLILIGSSTLNGTGNSANNAITGNAGNNVLDGGLGADAMAGGAGKDTYLVDNAGDTATENAGAGTDMVQASVSFTLGSNIENLTLTGIANISGTGNSEDNTIIGNAGNNVLEGGHGDDTLIAGAGDDTLRIDSQDIDISGGTGFDSAFVQTGTAVTLDLRSTSIEWAQGNAGNDVLVAARQSVGVYIYGLGGADTITGSAFADFLDGGDGNDTLAGGAGNDSLIGGSGDDSLLIDSSDVGIAGGAGFDSAIVQTRSAVNLNLGAASVEWAQGNFEGDIFNAASQNAGVFIYGLGGADKITGSAFGDFLDGGDGNDTMAGGDGNDILMIDSSDFNINGGAGFDSLFVRTGTGVNLNLWQASIEWAQGNTGNDIIGASSFASEGPAAAVYIYGMGGADDLVGSALGDYLDGGDGNDRLAGANGADTLIGGNGDDTLLIDGSDVTIDGGAGFDSALVNEFTAVSLNMGTSSIEWAHGSRDNDIFDASSQSVGVSVYGLGGLDTITGSAFADVLDGGDGNDSLTGGSGADTLAGGNGDDYLVIDSLDVNISGGAGFDSAVVQTVTAVNLNMGTASVEWARGNAGNDTFNAASQSTGVYIYGLDGIDTLTGSALIDFLDGGDGNDTLAGGGAIDTLIGGNGDDLLLGQNGDDALYGGSGADRLTGGTGNDLMIGEAGLDRYVYDATSWGADTIHSFDANGEKLDFSTVSAVHSFSDFTTFEWDPGNLGFNSTTLFYSNGGTTSTITLIGVVTSSLSNADFLFA